MGIVDEKQAGRIMAIDVLRGLVMVVMVLDHVRGGWNEGSDIDPLDLVQGYPWLFFTRWITHFCAPVFVFLTGLSAALSRKYRLATAAQSARRLLLRGLGLVALELLVTSGLFGMVFALNGVLFQVIGAIGVSLIVLAALQFLPSRVVAAVGLLIIALHNLIPDRSFDQPLANLFWALLHQKELIPFGAGWQVFLLYPVLPWIGVMALGWGMAELYAQPQPERRKLLVAAGALFVVAFVALRLGNIYGDPRPWQPQGSGLVTILDFIKVEKYPPSLDYVLMTLGPAFWLLAAIDRISLGERHPLVVFGRNPLFFYVVHLLLIDSVVIVADLVLYAFGVEKKIGAIPFSYPLAWTYIVWVGLLPILYGCCRLWMRRPRRKKPQQSGGEVGITGLSR